MNLRFDLSPHEYWSIAVRRKWLILIVASLCLGLAGGVSYILPKSYRSSTLILVENQKIAEHFVTSTVAGTVSDRLMMLNQYIVSRTVLIKIIDEFELASRSASDEEKEARIKDLRKNIKIETKGGGRVDAFTISYSHSHPHTAMKVTARLAELFLVENVKSREQFVEATSEFLDNELARAEVSLEGQERELAAYQKKYMGELPGQTEANLLTLNRLQKDLQSVSEILESRADKKAALQKTLNAYEAMGLALVETPSNLLPREPDDSSMRGSVVRIAPGRQSGRSSDSPVARVKELESRLAALMIEYKGTYPDVVQLKRELAQAKAALAEREDTQGDDVEKGGGPLTPQKSEKRNTVNPMDAYLHQLRKELNDSEVGIVRLTEQQTRLIAQTKLYEQRVERSPERQQELAVLQRDYENTKKNYQALLEKQLNARISANLEKRQKGEAFRILDPANLPTSPESPDVTKIMLTGLMLGCGLGFGSAFLLEQKTLAFRRPEDAESFLGFPVLASIPDFKLAFKSDPAKRLGVSSVPQTQHDHTGGSTRLGIDGSGTEARQKSKLLSLPWESSERNRSLLRQGKPRDSVEFELNLVAKWRPLSVVAEQFRVAATRLILSGSTQKSTIVVVTSAIQGEGKTTTSANLAYVLAHDLGKSTLVIDCDFKQPMLHSYSGTVSQPGLAEVIFGDAPLADCLHKPDDSPLWVLPCGRRDHHLVDLTKIPQIRSILSELRERFEFIILDAPPILPLADMNLLASIADMLVLVIRAGVTPQDMVSQAIKALKPEGRAGIIMTGYGSGHVYRQEYYLAGRGGYVK